MNCIAPERWQEQAGAGKRGTPGHWGVSGSFLCRKSDRDVGVQQAFSKAVSQ
jgi:hypothetical protein